MPHMPSWLVAAAMVAVTMAEPPPETPAQIAAEDLAEARTQDFIHYLLAVAGSVAGAVLLWRLFMTALEYSRHLAAMNTDHQQFFSLPNRYFAMFKKHLLYAPMFRLRHNKEFTIGSSISMGSLPTRFQFLFLAAYFGVVVTFSVVDIKWSSDFVTVASAFRNRMGSLAVTNMIPLFIMAARNNPLINWLNLSFDTFNLIHRWVGRIVVLSAILHVGAFFAGVMYSEGVQGGWDSIRGEISDDKFIMYGFIAFVAFFGILLQSWSPIRHAFYDTFKYFHIALVIAAIVGLWYHLSLYDFPQFKLLVGVISIWSLERFARVVRLVWRNVGNGGTKAFVEALPGNAVRVTVDMARPWHFKPGQHAYIYMPTIALMQSHPFSVAWSEDSSKLSEEKGIAMTRQDILALKHSSMSFIVRARTGFTKTLLDKANKSPDGKFSTVCLLEGPYGELDMMHSYGTVMLFAGGVGITHAVPHVRDLVEGFANGTIATRKIVLVWIIQSPEHLEWIQPWMTAILAMDQRRDCLRIMLFVSQPRSNKEIRSPSSSVQMFPGRPNIGTLLDAEIAAQVGAMGVSVCGPGALGDDVRRAVRERQGRSSIDFVEEAFSW